LIVLQLVEGETNAAIRQAAAVHFKNVVKNGWDAENDSGVVISPQDRDLIKNNLVQLMCSVPPSIQSQCSESIKLIAAQDFPAKWDNLLPMLVEKFASADPRVVNGVLLTANSLFKRFRYVQRSDSLYSDILYSLKHMQAPLLTLFQTTNASVDSFQGDQMQLIPRFESLRLISRIMFSLNYQDLPEFFEDNMKAVMTINAKFLKYENPLLTDDDEDTDPSPIDQLQAAIVENLNLYTDKDEECFLPYLGDFTQLVWGLLMRATDKPKHDVLATKCIRFLASLVKKKMHSDLFKEDATLRQIIASIVIPNLKIREVDEERFEDDPAEYIATDIEGSETESRRKCSQELLRAMCRQFGPQSTVICMQHIGTMLQEYQSNPGANWAAKDAAVSSWKLLFVYLSTCIAISHFFFLI
jgi:exportin-2 (importin alpha re-exporter)